ncbi:MAG TPA: hypothetical protein P5022_09745, partial [Candidatus Paceibacterota bacterium]|nr:hypothetical protein [Candidatus Paceibacterota bacterium]
MAALPFGYRLARSRSGRRRILPPIEVAREVLDQNGISGRKVVLAELRGVDPCKLCAANGLGLTAADAAAKETDTDDFFGVGVFDLAEESADIDFESELFAQFAGKAGFPGFTPLAFPA